MAMWDNGHSCCSSFKDFSEELCKVFDRSALRMEAARALSLLQQELFLTTLSSSARSLRHADVLPRYHFLHGLAEYIKDEIYSLKLPPSLDGLVDPPICIDNRISLRSLHRRGMSYHKLFSNLASGVGGDAPSQHLVLPEEEPIQIGNALSIASLH